MKVILALYLTISTGYLFYNMIDLNNITNKSVWQSVGLAIINMILVAVMRDVIQGKGGDKDGK